MYDDGIINFAFFYMIANVKPVHMQDVRWGVNDGLPAGIRVWKRDHSEERHDEEFLPWDILRDELERMLLPQILPKSDGYSFRTADYNGKKDWLVRIVDPQGEEYCAVWFGGDPEANWAFDGCVRIGDPTERRWEW